MVLFINETGHSMHFVICHRDHEKRDQIKELIDDNLGSVSTDMTSIGPHTAVLVDHKSWIHQRVETFRFEYIQDCIESSKILDISRYLLSPSKIYKPDFEYMDVIYFQKYEWQSVPNKFIIQACDSECEITESYDSSEDENDRFYAPLHRDEPKDKKKHTRRSYSRNEKEAIVQYIVTRNLYRKVKGVEIWKDLERLNICPIRTWQSLKEHTLKFISKEIHTFKSITKEEKKKLDEALNGEKERNHFSRVRR